MAPALFKPPSQKDAPGFPQDTAPRKKPPTSQPPPPQAARAPGPWRAFKGGAVGAGLHHDPRGSHGSQPRTPASHHKPSARRTFSRNSQHPLVRVPRAPPGRPSTSLRASPNGREAPRRQLVFEIRDQPITEKFIPPALTPYAATHASGPRGGGGDKAGHARSDRAKPKAAILTKVNRFLFFVVVSPFPQHPPEPFPEAIHDTMLTKGK